MWNVVYYITSQNKRLFFCFFFWKNKKKTKDFFFEEQKKKDLLKVAYCIFLKKKNFITHTFKPIRQLQNCWQQLESQSWL